MIKRPNHAAKDLEYFTLDTVPFLICWRVCDMKTSRRLRQTAAPASGRYEEPEGPPSFPPEDSMSGGIVMFGGGELRLPVSGGSLANLLIRSFSMSYAFISLNPGLRSPLTVVAQAEMMRVALRALQ
jgi:hypothetical protein